MTTQVLKALLAMAFLISCNPQEGGYKFVRGVAGVVSNEKVGCEKTDTLLAKESLAFVDSFQSTECSDYKFFACDSRIYSPEVENGTKMEKECLDEDNCVSVTQFFYNTASSFDAPDVTNDQMAEGGSLNFKEYYCYNKLYRDSKGVYLMRGTASTLEEALATTREKCAFNRSKEAL